MTRRKVSTTGVNGDLIFARKHNRKSADVEGRLRKKDKKRKGLKTGSRHSQGEDSHVSGNRQQRDPRLGSKKKIPLVVNEDRQSVRLERRLSAEEELLQLENDPQLQVLLNRLDNGEKLGAGLQQYVDAKLDRMEKLMKQLGLYDDSVVAGEDEDIDQAENDAVKPSGEDELLQKFADLDPDKF